MRHVRTLLEGAGIADGAGHSTGPLADGAVLLECAGRRCRVLAAGPTDRVRAHPQAADAARRPMDGRVLIPALVNAHTHLDLTGLGPRPFGGPTNGGFVGWLGSIRQERARLVQDGPSGAAAGCELLKRGGVAGFGDIVGWGGQGDAWRAVVDTLRTSELEGVAFLEVFGTGSRQPHAIEAMRTVADALNGHANPSDAPGSGGVRLGLQPHAPYSAGREVFLAAAQLSRAHDLPLATHLAESIDERVFLRDAAGALRRLREDLGLWEDAILADVGQGREPACHLREALRAAPWIAVHVNDCSDEALAVLVESGTHVVYCPRAAAYFEHERDLGPHRYREMLAAGINVALGTDSIVCIPPEQADRLSPLDDMRFLRRRDGADAETLLAMGTTHGARALGLDERRYTLAEGEIAGLLAVDVSGTPADAPAAERVLASDAPPEWVWPAEPAA